MGFGPRNSLVRRPIGVMLMPFESEKFAAFFHAKTLAVAYPQGGKKSFRENRVFLQIRKKFNSARARLPLFTAIQHLRENPLR